MLTVFQASSALLLPMVAACFGRVLDRRPWIALGLVAQLTGFGLLLYAPLGAPIVVVALLGVGLGSVFALTLDHTDDHALAASLVARIALNPVFGPSSYTRSMNRPAAGREFRDAPAITR